MARQGKTKRERAYQRPYAYKTTAPREPDPVLEDEAPEPRPVVGDPQLEARQRCDRPGARGRHQLLGFLPNHHAETFTSRTRTISTSIGGVFGMKTVACLRFR